MKKGFSIKVFHVLTSTMLLTASVSGVINSSPNLMATDCTPPPSGMVAWWPGEGSAQDVSGSNNGVLQGGVAFTPGQVGQAFHLSNGFIAMPADPSLNVGTGSGFTFEVWINPTTLSRQAIAEWNDNAGNIGAHLFISEGPFGSGPAGCLYANLFDSSGNNHFISTGGAVVTTNKYQHVALTYDPSNGITVLYLDGVQVASALLGSFIPQTSYNFYLGTRPSGSFAGADFNGAIDEPSLYNRALSTEEVASIYSAGSAGKCATGEPTTPTIIAGPITNSANGHVYYLLDGSNWTDAEAKAVSLGGHLVTINDAEENNWVVATFATYGGTNYSLWTGLNDAQQEGTFVWASGEPVSYTNWRAGEPNGGNGPEDDYTYIYGVIPGYSLLGQWNDTGDVITPGGSEPSLHGVVEVPAVVTECTPPPSGLVAWWPGEGNGDDMVGTNNGVWAGYGNLNTYGAGTVGQAFVFDGTHRDRVDIGSPASLQLQNFTIEAWVKRSSATVASLDENFADGSIAGPGAYIFGYGAGGYGLFLTDTGEVGLTKNSVGDTRVSPVITDTNWHHVAVTKSGTDVAFYVDGVQQPTPAPDTATFEFTSSAAIGSRGDGGGNTLYGMVDELSIYNHALSSNEIAAIYNAGSAGKCQPGLPAVIAGPITNSANGHAYFLLNSSSWTDAEAEAVALGGHLATINNADQNTWVQSTFGANGTRALWIGLNDAASEGTFTWVSGESSSYRNWTTGEPNNFGGNENYAYIGYPTFYDGTWNDQPDSGFNPASGLDLRGEIYGVVELPAAAGSGGCLPALSDMVAWWKGESNILDSVGTNVGSVTTGKLGYAAAEVGEGFRFDGDANRILVPDAPALNFGSNQDFSIEAWIQPQTSATTYNVMSIVDKRYSNGGVDSPQGYEFNLGDGKIHCRFMGTGFGPYGPDLRDGNFHHVALSVSRNSSTGGNLYVDGQLVGTFDPTPYSGSLSNSQPLRIGNHADNSFSTYFKGIIDEVSIYRHALSSNEIAAIYAAGSAGKCATVTTNGTPTLIDVDFGGGSTRPIAKTGPAAIGLNDSDLWNFYTRDGTNGNWLTFGSLPNLKRVDGTVTSIGLTVANAPGDWGNGSTDPMFNDYIYPFNGGNVTITVTNLPAGSYDLYAYSANSRYAVTAGGINYGVKSVFEPVATNPPVWIEGVSYARFTNIVITAGQPLVLTALPLNDVANISGLQIVSSTATSELPTNCTPAPSGLVAWWPGEDGGQDVVSGNDGTLINGASFDTGKVGDAFNLNGINQYVLVNPKNSALDVGLESGLTLEAWIKPATLSQRLPIIEYEKQLGTFNGADVGVQFYACQPPGSGDFYVNIQDTANIGHVITSTNNLVVAGAWQHVALTYNKSAGIATIYLNGQIVTQTNVGSFTPQTSFTNLLIGARTTFGSAASPSDRFAGEMDEVTLYNRALSSNEIAAIYNAGSAGKCEPVSTNCPPAPAGLVAWWPAEGNGKDIIAGNDGMLHDGVTFASGEVGQAFLLDNSNAYLRVPASSSLKNIESGSGLTIEAWIDITNVSGFHPIAEWNDGTGHVGAHFWLGQYPWSNGALFANIIDTNGNSHVIASPNSSVAGNTFQHVALTYDQATGVGTLYVNGTIVTQSNLGSFTPQTSYDFWIGHRQGDSPGDWTYASYLGGLLDELSVYDRALSTNEITAIYAAGSAGKCAPETTNATPTLIDVDFGGGSTRPIAKTGPAAIGLNDSDFWNFYTRDDTNGSWLTFGSLPNLKLVDGTVTGIGMTVANAPGDWGNGSTDPMFNDYLYPFNGGNVTITVTNLPAGSYDLYAYSANSSYRATSAGIDYGIQSTYEPTATNPPVWIEGFSYVRFTNVVVTAGQPLVLTALPLHDVANISGLQIVSSSAANQPTPTNPPAITKVDHFSWSMVASPQGMHSPFTVSVTARDAANATMTNFAGPVNLSGWTNGGSGTEAIEDFESGIWPHAPWISASAGTSGVVSPTFAHDGSYGLSDPAWYYLTNVSLGNPGDTLSYWIRTGSGSTGRAYLGFGASNTGCWAIVAAPNTSGFILQHNTYASYTNMLTVPQTWQSGKWYKITAQFASPSALTCKLYDSDGTTLLNSLTYSNVTGLPGGVAIRSFGGISMDTITGSAPASGQIPVAPTISGNFVNGSWTGTISVLQPATNVMLTANDGAGHFGSSNPFDVIDASSASVTNILFLDRTSFGESPFATALTNLALPNHYFNNEAAFLTALASANPNRTLAIINAPNYTLSLTNLPDFIGAGGRVVLSYWNLSSLPTVATALQVGTIQNFTSPLSVYDWGGSTLFTNVGSPLNFAETVFYIDGTKLQPLAGARAIAGFTDVPNTNQAAVVIGNSGRTLVNGFLLDEANPFANGVQLAENEIQLLTSSSTVQLPIIISQPVGVTVSANGTATFSVTAQSLAPLNYQWRFNGTNTVGGNSDTLVLTNVSCAQIGAYSVLAANSMGETVSSNAALRVLVPQVLSLPKLQSDGSFQLTSRNTDGSSVSAADLANFEVQVSTNLIDWATLPNGLSLTNGHLQLQDSARNKYPSRFYRIIEH